MNKIDSRVRTIDPCAIPSSETVGGTTILSDTISTLVANNIIYTGSSATQTLTTNIESKDINWEIGLNYTVGDLAFTKDGVGVTAEAFTLWECTTIHTSGSIAGTNTIGDAQWTIVADDIVKLFKSSKVTISNRAGGEIVTFDTLRGKDNLIETSTSDVEENVASILAFTNTGVSIDTLDSRINLDANNYVLFQEAYHKIMITTTNHGKKALVAFDDVTNKSMMLYQGSQLANHELPHQLGQTCKISHHKNLDTATTNWLSHIDTFNATDLSLSLNQDMGQVTDATKNSFMDNYIVRINANTEDNKSNSNHIAYFEAESDVANIYVSADILYNDKLDISGNIIQRTSKIITEIGNWNVTDTARGNTERLSLNLNTGDATIAAITDIDGVDDCNVNIVSSATLVQISNRQMIFSNGYTQGYADNSVEYSDIVEVIAPTFVINSMNYLKKVKDGVWMATAVEPTFGKASTIGDYYVGGKWYNSSDVEYTEPLTYLNMKVECDSAGIPVSLHPFIYSNLLATHITADNLTLHKLPITDPLVENVIWNNAGVLTISSGV
ncbi:MAG: hypothetical protein U9Q83_05130 [Bacteroidota bacterium]|nr:hypothetical protein [Bacteroidota bacterium]